MNRRKWWFGIVGGGGLLAAGLGAVIYLELGRIEREREEIGQLRSKIESARKLVEGNGTLEREVIVLREMSRVIQDILPNEADVNNLVRTFQRFSDEADTRIRGLRKIDKPGAQKGKEAFEEVAYTITMEADAFQFLDFLNRVETYSRFMRVPRFRIDAADRKQVETDGQAAHKIQLDVETFVYEPSKQAEPVAIEGYERKRDLLMGEIIRRRQALSFASYTYRGARGRRDPWVDPRVPVAIDGEAGLTVQEQMERVEDLVQRASAAREKWQEVRDAQNVIEELMARAELEEALASIEDELRRLEAEGSIRYVPSQRRLQLEVADVVQTLRDELVAHEGGRGPSVEKLREVLESMNRHLALEEYALMLDAYRLVENQLEYVASDPMRKPFVDELNRLAGLARTVIDFEQHQVEVTGVAIMEGRRPAAIVNGRAVGVGDLLDGELVIRDIREGEIEFIYRGVILAKRF